MDILHKSLQILANQCDGAQSNDGTGFNKFDTRFGRSLAIAPELTNGQRRAAYDMLRKYRNQLRNGGIIYDDIPVPEQATSQIDFQSGLFIIRFEYDRSLVDAVRGIPGRRWNGKQNTAPLASREYVQKFVDEHGSQLTAEAWNAINNGEIEERPEPKSSDRLMVCGELVKIYFSYDRSLVDAVRGIPGRRWNKDEQYWTAPISSVNEIVTFANRWGIDTSPLNEIERQVNGNLETSSRAELDEEFEVEGLGGELRPFQNVAVKYGLQNKRILIADEMGLGKTVEALALIKAIDKYPVLVVCPASLTLNWKYETEKWLLGANVQLLEGQTSGLINCDIAIISYSVLAYWQDAIIDNDFQVGIADESHYVKNYKSRRANAAKDIFENLEYRYLLTGTPIMNRPVELDHQLQVLGQIDQFGGSWNFRKRYCGAKKTRWGWDFSGATNLDELHIKLKSTCYIRRLKTDVLTELPPKQYARVMVDIDNRAEYEREKAEIREYLRGRADEFVRADDELLQEIAGLSPDEQQAILDGVASDKYHRSLMAEMLVLIERLKQVIARGKMKAIKLWVGDVLDGDEKLILFANHREIVLELAKEFDAPYIIGGQDAQSVEDAKSKFQSDPDTKIIVCNIQAGGVGHTLTAATNVAFVELAWRPSDHSQAEDRAHRIGQNESITCWYFIGNDTIDADIYDLLQVKARVIDAVTDGGRIGSVHILDTLVNKLQ